MSATWVSVDDLTPHPRNYRSHPEDQLVHLTASIKEHGFYRNIVATKDGTILAGHGVVEAARQMGHKRVPVIQLDISPDDPKALKVMTGDNAISHLAEEDDRALTEILKELCSIDELVGTGFDDTMLAALAMVTRPASEIEDFNAAAEWVGMPEFEAQEPRIQLVVSFRTRADRQKLIEHLNVKTFKPAGVNGAWSCWWPLREKDHDLASLIYEG